MFVACCAVFAACCLLVSLFVDGGSLRGYCCALFDVCFLLLGVPCSLFAVC